MVAARTRHWYIVKGRSVVHTKRCRGSVGMSMSIRLNSAHEIQIVKLNRSIDKNV